MTLCGNRIFGKAALQRSGIEVAPERGVYAASPDFIAAGDELAKAHDRKRKLARACPKTADFQNFTANFTESRPIL
jgi:hypothetical protein